MSDTPVNYFEYIDPSFETETAERIKINAEKLYLQISDFYTFLVESIGPDDYINMQQHFGYTESYQEHIDSLTEGVPDKETTIQQITDFLKVYKEFEDPDYIKVLTQLNSRVQMNRELCKMQAYQILTQQSQQLKQREEQMQRGMTQGKVEAIVGGKVMSIESYNNPLLVSLYSLLLVWFSLKNYGEPPKPLIQNEIID